ncbi:MAG: hypothetical protein ACYDAO_10255 [Thermoplasmataceae archaeon]
MNRKRTFALISVALIISIIGIYVELNSHKHNSVYLSIVPEKTLTSQGSCLLINVSSNSCLNYKIIGSGNCVHNIQHKSLPYVTLAYLGNDSNYTYKSDGGTECPKIPGYDHLDMLPFSVSNSDPNFVIRWNVTWRNNDKYTVAPAGYYELIYAQDQVCTTDFSKTIDNRANTSINHEIIKVTGIKASVIYNYNCSVVSTQFWGENNTGLNVNITLQARAYVNDALIYGNYSFNSSIPSTCKINLTENMANYVSKLPKNYGFMLFCYIEIRYGIIMFEGKFV